MYSLTSPVTSSKKNKDDDSTQVLNTITIYGTDGVKTKYYADGKLAAITNANKHDYVTLTQNKDTELITAAEKAEDWESTDAAKGILSDTFSNEKLIMDDDTEVKTVSGGVILLRYTEEGSTKYKVVDYTDVNVLTGTVYVWYNKTNVSKDGKKVDSDMIVVEQEAAAPIVSKDIEISGTPVADLIADGDDYMASTRATALQAKVKNLGTGVTVKSYQWYVSADGVEVAEPVVLTSTGKEANAKTLDLTDVANVGCGQVAGNEYYLVVVDSNDDIHMSPTVTVATPVTASLTVDELSATYGTALTTSNTSLMKDQFRQLVTAGDYTFALDDATATVATLNDLTTGIGATLTIGDGKIEVTTTNTTPAGTYEIDIYNQAAGDIDEDSVLVGTITLTVDPFALTVGSLGYSATDAAETALSATAVTTADFTKKITADANNFFGPVAAVLGAENDKANLVWSASCSRSGASVAFTDGGTALKQATVTEGTKAAGDTIAITMAGSGDNTTGSVTATYTYYAQAGVGTGNAEDDHAAGWYLTGLAAAE